MKGHLINLTKDNATQEGLSCIISKLL